MPEPVLRARKFDTSSRTSVHLFGALHSAAAVILASVGIVERVDPVVAEDVGHAGLDHAVFLAEFWGTSVLQKSIFRSRQHLVREYERDDDLVGGVRAELLVPRNVRIPLVDRGPRVRLERGPERERAA